jgi:aminocarboxymuconate-semialdehyde decarboxylase
VAECGVGQIMTETDYPFPWNTRTIDHVLKTPGSSDWDKAPILGETPARLLKLA